jgi:hypothetical protein
MPGNELALKSLEKGARIDNVGQPGARGTNTQLPWNDPLVFGSASYVFLRNGKALAKSLYSI